MNEVSSFFEFVETVISIEIIVLSFWVFLYRYRITEGVNLPFRVLPTIKELGRTRMEVNVKVCDHLWSMIMFYCNLLVEYISIYVHIYIFFSQVKSVFGAKMFALGVVIKIPVPKQTAKTNFQVTSGRAKYNPAIDCLVWK